MQVGQVALLKSNNVGFPFFNALSIEAIELLPAELVAVDLVETGVCWVNFGTTIKAAINITAIAMPIFTELFISLHILHLILPAIRCAWRCRTTAAFRRRLNNRYYSRRGGN
jgi:hypothetical protein